MNNFVGAPLQLQTLTRQGMQLNNRLNRVGRALDFNFKDRVGQLQVYTQGTPRIPPSFISISILLDDHPAWLRLTKAFLKARLQGFLSPEQFAGLPRELRLALIEAALDDELELLERIGAASIQITGVAAPRALSTDEVSICFALTWQNEAVSPVEGYLSLSAALLPRFLNALAKAPTVTNTATAAWESLLGVVRFEAGYTRLPTKNFHSIALGDIVFCDRCLLAQENFLAIHIMPNVLLKGRLKDNAVMVEDKLEDPMLTEPEPSLIDIDAVEINLVFDIGEIKLPLRDLKAIQAGFIFKLNTSLEQPVTMRVHGQAVAQGELIQVDDRIGVRITALHGKPHG